MLNLKEIFQKGYIVHKIVKTERKNVFFPSIGYSVGRMIKNLAM